MSLISCNDKCRHQVDGYCNLKTSVQTFSNIKNDSNCAYFSPKTKKKA